MVVSGYVSIVGTRLGEGKVMSELSRCPWCYELATVGCWTPRHGWINLCQRHYNETSREVISHLLHKVGA